MQQLLTKGIGHSVFQSSELGDIPESWEVFYLGDLIDKILGGGTPERKKSDYWNGEVAWATVKDLKKSKLTHTEESITKEGVKNSAANLIPANTLIIATRMALGKAVFFNKEVAINQDLKALFPISKLNKDYLFYWYVHNAEIIARLGVGSTVKGITLDVLKCLKLSLPPISEQLKIVSIFKVVDEKLEILRDKGTAYQEIKSGLMQQLLTGKIRVNSYQRESAVA